MRGALLHHHGHARVIKPLVVRGGLGRTFGSLISFLALTLLAWGGYLLEDEFAHPVEAYPAALLTAAFTIALGLLLFFYLCKPRRTSGVKRRQGVPVARGTDTLAQHSVRTRNIEARRDLAYQRIYVDHSRIRLRRFRSW